MIQPANHPAGWQLAVRKPFQWLDTVLNWFERSVLVVGIILMAFFTILGVITRNLGASLTFVGEVSQILVVIVTFVGLGHGVRNARHIRVSAIHDLLPPRGQKVLLTLISFTTCILLFFFGLFAVDYVERLARSGRVVPSLQVPVYLFYIVVPLGLFVGSVQYLLAGVRNLISPGNYLSWVHKDEYEAAEDVDMELASGGTPLEAHEQGDSRGRREKP